MFFVPTTKTDLVYVQYDVQLKLTYIGSNLMGGMKRNQPQRTQVSSHQPWWDGYTYTQKDNNELSNLMDLNIY